VLTCVDGNSFWRDVTVLSVQFLERVQPSEHGWRMSGWSAFSKLILSGGLSSWSHFFLLDGFFDMKIAVTADPMLPVPPRLYGGIERIIDMLVRGLVDRRHEVTLFAHEDSEVPC